MVHVGLASTLTAAAMLAGAVGPLLWQEQSFTQADINPDDNVRMAVQRTLDSLLPRGERTVRASVVDGTALLFGTTTNLYTRLTAAHLAAAVDGVTAVDNRIQVVPPQHRTDGDIGRDVHVALVRDAYLHAEVIRFRVLHGVVCLEGVVDSPAKPDHATLVLAQIPGVLDVDNQVRVVTEPLSRQDARLVHAIKRGLIWSPWVSADDVQVIVKDGVVELEGTVASEVQRAAAEEIARRAGADAVINNLALTMPGRFRKSVIP